MIHKLTCVICFKDFYQYKNVSLLIFVRFCSAPFSHLPRCELFLTTPTLGQRSNGAGELPYMQYSLTFAPRHHPQECLRVCCHRTYDMTLPLAFLQYRRSRERIRGVPVASVGAADPAIGHCLALEARISDLRRDNTAAAQFLIKAQVSRSSCRYINGYCVSRTGTQLRHQQACLKHPRGWGGGRGEQFLTRFFTCLNFLCPLINPSDWIRLYDRETTRCRGRAAGAHENSLRVQHVQLGYIV